MQRVVADQSAPYDIIANMQIVVAPNPILSEKAKAVLKADKSILHTIAKMKDVLSSAHDPIGVGLAAPQIGKSLQIFIAKPTPKGKVSVFINPKITKMDTPSQSFTREHKIKNPKSKKEEVQKLEGCLSLKDIWGNVLRSPTVRLSYLDEKGKKHTRTFKGLLATIIQHEIDHLNGVLFTKRVLEQKGKLYKRKLLTFGYKSYKNKQSPVPDGTGQSLRSGELKKGEEVFEELEI